MVAPSTKPFLPLTHSDECRISQQFQKQLKRAAISLIHDKIASVVGKDGQLEALCTKGGRRSELDQLFSQQGATLQTKLAADVGVTLDDNGYIVADSEQRTSVPGVYAAGDVTRLHSHQVTTAVHEGGQAASAANYFLFPPELKDD